MRLIMIMIMIKNYNGIIIDRKNITGVMNNNDGVMMI
jgi:hypothetical protein